MKYIKMNLSKLVYIIVFVFTSAFGFAAPYVVVVSYDGFRHDYLSRGITPALDEVKNEGVWAMSLQSSFPSITFPNHVSILTGMYPEHHGILLNYFKDLRTGNIYTYRDSNQVRNPDWYKGEFFWETAKKNGIKTASYFWPGSEMTDAQRRPDYFEKYVHTRDYKSRIDGVIKWLNMPQDVRPHFINVYFDDTDSKGHEFGTNSLEVNNSIRLLDSISGYLLGEIKRIGLGDSVNVIFLSDHGMTNTPEQKNIDLTPALSGYKFFHVNAGAIAMIKPDNPAQTDEIIDLINSKSKHLRAYRKSKVPKYLHFSQNDNILDIVVIAEATWSIVLGNSYKSNANHGYDCFYPDMNGIFVAKGPAFKQNFYSSTLRNIDIYPMLCKIFNIKPNDNIDGDLERIKIILRDK